MEEVFNEDFSKPTTTDCQVALSEIFESIQNRDVYNFLFTPEPIDQGCFEDPNLVKTAIAATFSSKRYSGEHVEQVQGHMLYVPSFTISDLHLGFGYHYRKPVGSTNFTTEQRAHARYVFDAKRRTFITVLKGAEGSCVISYKRFMSTTCHTRYTVLYEGKPGEAGDYEGWVRRVNCMYSGVEFRECVYCKRLRCDCEFRDQRAEHPFDDSGFRDAVNGTMGKFNGFGRVESYVSGIVVQAITVGCEIRVGACNDTKVVEELRELGRGGGGGGGGAGRKVVSEIKAELRRERNRAAARKSNRKKKMLNDGMKLAVWEERQKVARLREREERLRIQNLELRRLLAHEGVSELGG